MAKKVKGKVIWFDTLVGEGVVKSEMGDRYYVHYSAIEAIPTLTTKKAKSIKSHKALKPDQAVEFTIYENAYLKQVKTIREVG